MKTKNLLMVVFACSLTACNSGGGGDGSSTISQLTAYPPSGNYIGSATSSYGEVSTIQGTISGSSGSFYVVDTVVGVVNGVFQLNNNTCFVGSITASNQSVSFVATNCSYNNGLFTGSYQNGWGSVGTLSLTKQ